MLNVLTWDITNRNTEEQWKNAARAMKELDGKVPYCLTTGNHDYGKGGGCADRGARQHRPVAAPSRGDERRGGHQQPRQPSQSQRQPRRTGVDSGQ